MIQLGQPIVHGRIIRRHNRRPRKSTARMKARLTMDRENGTEALKQFSWERQPEAERLIRDVVKAFLDTCPEAAAIAERMKSETGTRFMDWIDYIQLADRSKFVPRLKSTGFILKPEWDGEGAICW